MPFFKKHNRFFCLFLISLYPSSFRGNVYRCEVTMRDKVVNVQMGNMKRGGLRLFICISLQTHPPIVWSENILYVVVFIIQRTYDSKRTFSLFRYAFESTCGRWITSSTVLRRRQWRTFNELTTVEVVSTKNYSICLKRNFWKRHVWISLTDCCQNTSLIKTYVFL